MNKIQEVKERADIIKVAEYFNLNLNRANKCKCIWHKENTASLSFSQSKQIFKCFGCDTTGDCITLVSKLLKVNAYESAKTINNIFHLGVDFGQTTTLYELNKYKQKRDARKQFIKWENNTFQLLCDYLHSLDIIEKYQQQDTIDYFIDLFIYGTEEEKIWFKKSEERWCKQIESRLRRNNARRISTL